MVATTNASASFCFYPNDKIYYIVIFTKDSFVTKARNLFEFRAFYFWFIRDCSIAILKISFQMRLIDLKHSRLLVCIF